MNKRLLDPFQALELPEVIEEYLDHGTARCAAFNRRGTLLAAGTEEGWVVIWDFDTRGVAKWLRHASSQQQDGPTQRVAITSLCWSRDGRFLASGSLDKTVVLWDVETGSTVFESHLESGVTHVSLSPRKPFKLLATLQKEAPVLLDVETGTAASLPSVVLEPGGGVDTTLAHAVATFSKNGSMVLLGQAKGLLAVYETNTQKVVDIIKVPGAPRVVGMHLNRKGSLLLLNCHDRIIRLFELAQRQKDAPAVDISQLGAAIASAPQAGQGGSLLLGASPMATFAGQFLNAVERTQWQGVAFTADCEHVAAAALAKEDHNVYIWTRHYGKLERILEGPRNEAIVGLAWHPCRSMVVTISSNGRMYIWSKIFQEKWSAFAPDFQEVEENVEYVEREDEFDENPTDAAATADAADEEEEDVDVLTRDDTAFFSSDDEEDRHALHYLTAEVQMNGPELIGADDGGQQGPQQGDSGTAAQGQLQQGQPGASTSGDAEADGMDQPTSTDLHKRKDGWDADGVPDGPAKRGRSDGAGPSGSGLTAGENGAALARGGAGYSGQHTPGAGPGSGGAAIMRPTTAAEALSQASAARTPGIVPGPHHSLQSTG